MIQRRCLNVRDPEFLKRAICQGGGGGGNNVCGEWFWVLLWKQGRSPRWRLCAQVPMFIICERSYILKFTIVWHLVELWNLLWQGFYIRLMHKTIQRILINRNIEVQVNITTRSPGSNYQSRGMCQGCPQLADPKPLKRKRRQDRVLNHLSSKKNV